MVVLLSWNYCGVAVGLSWGHRGMEMRLMWRNNRAIVTLSSGFYIIFHQGIARDIYLCKNKVVFLKLYLAIILYFCKNKV